MDFILSEEQNLLVNTVTRFVETDYTFERRKGLIEAGETVWSSLAELGLCALHVPEEYGGLEASAADCMLVMDALGRGIVAEPFVANAVIPARLFANCASDAIRAGHLGRLADGSTRYSPAVYEPDARYDLAACALKAERDGDGFSLTGTKSSVDGGACADYLIVSARTSGAPGESEGLTLFLVDAREPGVSVTAFPTIDGQTTANVEFDNVRVDADAIVGELDAGFEQLERAIDLGIAAICAEAVGAMARLTDITSEYVQERKQFGKPIGSFQVIQHRLADMMIAVEQARGLAYMAAAHADQPDAEQRRRSVSAAKAMVSQSGRFVGQQAIQLHGGMGMTDEMPCGHYVKRLTAIDMTYGDRQDHLERFIAVTDNMKV